MKSAFSHQRTPQLKKAVVAQRASVGPNGISVAPPNRTGLPDALKGGVESLSGLSLNDVRVHYNSPKPAGLNALAYTQGPDIHVAPRQERNLPHEAWHVVQQKQGRVRPTLQMKGEQINDDTGLEREADVMGQRALQVTPWQLRSDVASAPKNNSGRDNKTSPSFSVQRVIQRNAIHTDKWGNVYRTETFATNRERPKSVRAEFHSTSTKGRGSAPPAIALYNPTNATFDHLLGYDGGHVLGLELGGADESYNVVPMLPKFNRDTWRSVETQLRSTARFVHSGQNFRFNITVDYADESQAIPESLAVKGYADVPVTKKDTGGKRVQTGRVQRGKEVLDVTKRQPDDIETTPAPTREETKIFLGTKPKQNKVLSELAKREDFSTDAFLQYIRTNGHLPVSKSTEYPDDPADRPNEYLDILVLSGQVYSDANFAAWKEFSSTQRELILKYNMAKNGGRLMSDDPSDPHQYLSETGAADFPEVDHIIPKSQGGSNFFSNARLVSWQLNNKEDRVKDITPFIGFDRISYPGFTGSEASELRLSKGILIVKKWLDENRIKKFTRLGIIGEIHSKYYHLSKKKVDALIDDVLSDLVTSNFIESVGVNKYQVK